MAGFPDIPEVLMACQAKMFLSGKSAKGEIKNNQ